MPRIIEEVAVKISADTRGLNKGLKQSRKKVSALSGAFKKLGATMIGVFGARALFTGFKRTLDSADQLFKTAKGISFTVNEYQRLVFALDQVGISAGSAKIAIGDFQKRLSKAVAGTSPQFRKAFEAAGLDVDLLAAMAPAAALDAAMTHLASMRGDPRLPGFVGNVLEEQSGKDFLAVIRQWPKYMAARENFASRVGSLSEKQVADIQELREETKLYGQQWEMLKMQIVGDVAPDIIKAFRDLEEAGAFKNMVEGLTKLILELNRFADTVRAVATLINKIPLPAWVKKAASTPGGFSPQGALAKVFRIEDVLPGAWRSSPPSVSAWTKGTNAQRSESGPATVVNQTNNFSIGPEENARLNKAWRKINDQHQRAGAR